MTKVGLLFILSAVNFISIDAECANGCSGHGRCTSYDMCVCNRNWMANDCSERVCQFGLAHVDTPKGDLDMDGIIEDANKMVAVNNFIYPYGTTEQFPAMQDTNLQYIPQSAHYYMECSNKGVCDRATGTCQCYDGYDGAACQRASCPGFPENTCSGHGVCRSIEQLANDEYGNIYKLWDRKSTMGCKCDAGYYGPDCSQRQCKHGVDPLYLDDTATLRFSTFDVAVLTTSTVIDFNDGTPLQGQAYFSIRFYDVFGEDWLTEPIKSNATCEDVMDALYAIPNNVVPSNSIWCTLTSNAGADGINEWMNGVDYHYPVGSDSPNNYLTSVETGHFKNGRIIKYPLAFWSERVRSAYMFTVRDASDYPISGNIYRLKFLGNPGKLRQPEIEIYLDGKRPSIVSLGGKVITAVWTDGQLGESKDFFADHCDGVSVKLGYYPGSTSEPQNHKFFLTGFSAAEKAKLKTCLGSADFNGDNNVEVYNWDYGSKSFPHMIKLVKTHTTYTDGGYYVALYYTASTIYTKNTLDDSGVDGTFLLLNPFYSPDDYGFAYKFQTSVGSTDTTGVPYYGTDPFEVYTTKGSLALTSNYSQATFGFGSQEIFMTNVSYDVMAGLNTVTFDGDISCEVGATNGFVKHGYVQYCLNRTDYFTVLNFERPAFNPAHINLYQAMKLSVAKYSTTIGEIPDAYSSASMGSWWVSGLKSGPNAGQVYAKQRLDRGVFNHANDKRTAEAHFMVNSIVTDISTNWAVAVTSDSATETYLSNVVFHVYKFFPSTDSTYEYVAPCSNRGLCDTTSGLCTCFPGYATDDCSEQNSLHV